MQERYQLMDGVRALITGDWSSHGAGLVRELSQEVARTSGLSATGERSFFVPFSALSNARLTSPLVQRPAATWLLPICWLMTSSRPCGTPPRGWPWRSHLDRLGW